METANTLTVQQRTALLDTLQARFERNERLHPGIAWENVRAKLEADDGKLRSLFAMEKTGGQPDVVAYDHAADAYVFYDCAPESPAGRRNLCKTSSWIETPVEVRALGGALFCDRRFNRVFTFHNGAESYYASRGFRGSLRV